MSVRFGMVGADRWARDLRLAARQVPDTAAELAAELGQVLESTAREICPSGDGGRLRASIGHYAPAFLETADSGSVPGDAHFALERRPGLVHVEVGTRVPYAAQVEYGTSTAAGAHFMEVAVHTTLQQVERKARARLRQNGLM